MRTTILSFVVLAFSTSICAGPDVRDTLDQLDPNILNAFAACNNVKQKLRDPSALGNYPIGKMRYVVRTNANLSAYEQGNVANSALPIVLTASVRYPARDRVPGSRFAPTNAPVAEEGAPFPLVLYVHGGGLPPAGYHYVLDRLASHGIIAASISGFNDDSIGEDTSDPTTPDPYAGDPGRSRPIEIRVDAILRHLWLWSLANDPERGIYLLRNTPKSTGLAGPIVHFNNRVNLARIGLAGQSRGGEAILLAALRNTSGYPPFPRFHIKALHVIAPSAQSAEVQGRLDLDMPYFQLLGSNDGDNHNGRDGIKTYDRIVAPVKMHAFLYGADHNCFNSTLGLGDCEEPTSVARMSWGEQLTFERVLAVAFFRQFLPLVNSCRCLGLFNGTATTSALPQRRIFWSYQSAGDLVIKDFEELRLLEWSRERRGVDRVGGRFTLPPEPDSQPSDHDAGRLIVSWSNRQETLTINVPPNITDNEEENEEFSHLQFRVAQLLDADRNVRGQNQDFEVKLVDAQGHSRAIRVGAFSEIPWPFEDLGLADPKSVLHTVRLPLGCYRNSGVDTNEITEIQFLFNQTPKGAIALDDIAFSH